MDPNNIQQTNSEPIMQPQQPIAGVPPQPQQPLMTPPPIMQQPEPQITTPIINPTQPTPQNSNKKGIILIAIILLLVMGMAGYIMFAGSITNKLRTANTSVAIPTLIPRISITPPTPAIPPTIDEMTIYNPEIDIKALEDGLEVL